MKIVINTCYGGFGLNPAASKILNERVGRDVEFDIHQREWRNHPLLIALVEEMGDACWGQHSELRIVEIPDDVKDWYISEYDGFEHVAEGRTWYAYRDIPTRDDLDKEDELPF